MVERSQPAENTVSRINVVVSLRSQSVSCGSSSLDAFCFDRGLAGSDTGPGTRPGLSGAVRARQNGNMIETLWQPSLVLALYQNRNAPTSRYVQLATACTDGRPSNRTVVFRGFIATRPL